ncbi:hypothetical protein AG1IA_08294 [Rhizoctonia solani AG-1 IA]|uniref:Uncharacterized protein n=1 Tax=Thanatephorus cucumeris (strain AG1-IA) TaxID=983506 RepID=L8WID6_THACA|nr:hypothetical protein AG1IA_08294 [Rhizoctonia solani AG-1 IA]
MPETRFQSWVPQRTRRLVRMIESRRSHPSGVSSSVVPALVILRERVARGRPSGWERHMYRMEEEEEDVEREWVEDVRLEASTHVIHGKKPGDPKRRSLDYPGSSVMSTNK